ncbi:hypothetical protein [Psychromonas sp. Urea-02u-13]|uniref:hypothetical protein n=1 Tax=Psychromonas sp. Urea-02u-13 TaxID=2058326 RepID=UPI000C31C33C|nr:hypothetical protein [Psychromonas sp. Urea-02u-13]PKG37338.1 hypothetical protein CXF74_19410 [Psychromonas sp. Urea-02u-13]
MAVHPSGFYIHVSKEHLTDAEKVDEAKLLTENEGYDFVLEKGESLVIEEFSDEHSAESFETQVLEILATN